MPGSGAGPHADGHAEPAFTPDFSTVGAATAAAAADWPRYINARFGTTVDIPPGFQGEPESENGDGRRFVSRDGTVTLLIWGSNLPAGDLSARVADMRQTDTGEGWEITYVTGRANRAVYSGTRSHRIVYVRATTSCWDRLAHFARLEYPQEDRSRLDSLVVRIAKSLSAGPGLECP